MTKELSINVRPRPDRSVPVQQSLASVSTQEFSKAVCNLPGTIEQVLENPEDINIAKRLILYISTASISKTPKIPLLTPTWRLLEKELDPQKNILLQNFGRPLTALVIFEAISVQTSLPAKEKAFFGTIQINPDMAFASLKANSKNSENDEVSYVNAFNKAAEFQKEVEDILKKVPQNEEDLLLKLRFLSDCMNIRVSFLSMSSRPLLSPEFSKWFDNLIAVFADNTNVLASPLAQQLLFSEKLNEIRPSLHYYAWRDLWQDDITKDNKQPADDKILKNKELVEYFLAHPNIWQPFWQSKTGKNSTEIDRIAKRDHSTGRLPEVLNRFKLNMDLPILLQFFIYDQETFRQFLTTAKSIDIEEGRISLYRKLIGALGALKNENPNSTSLPIIANELESFLQQEKESANLQKELSILKDEIAGIVYVDTNLHVQAKTPKNNVFKEEFLREQDGLGRTVVYVSSAPWPEPQIETAKQEPVKPVEQERPVLMRGQTISLKPWGEVQVPISDQSDGLKTSVIIDHLQEKLNALKLSEDFLFNLLVTYSNDTILAKGDTLLPDLILNHPLSNLKSLGIIGISHSNENVVHFIMNSNEIGIGVIGPQRLLLSCKLNEKKELEFPNVPNGFSYSPLYFLLNAAALFGKMPYTPYALLPKERREEHLLQQSWRAKAKRNGLPQLISSDAHAAQTVNGTVVRLIIGEKMLRFDFV